VEPEPKSSEIVELVRTVAADWQPDASLNTRARRSLRDQLFPFAIDRCFVLAVVALPDALEEKSRVAAELALSLAEPAHQRTLLMEGNFERPAVHRVMRVQVPFGFGFSRQLHARIQAQTQAPLAVVTCGALHVLGEGALRSPGLTLSRQFEESIERLRRYYDFIVIDGPHASQQVECRALDAVVDGVVLVCQNQQSPDVERTLAAFSSKAFKTVVAARREVPGTEVSGSSSR
jgi:Mrp family chromosome partitioning ATPase